MIVVIDACALLAFLRDEPGAEVVEQFLFDLTNECIVHAVNACEVQYDSVRSAGAELCDLTVRAIELAGVSIDRRLDPAFCRRVAILKGTVRASLADCFAIALANELDATVLTSDHHEFDAILANAVCRVIFIR